MRHEAYPKYKSSGIEWLGDVPEHWVVKRLKDVGVLRGGAGFPHEEQCIANEELPFYKVGDLKASLDGRFMAIPEHTISKETARKLRAAIIPPGSIVYSKIGAALLLNRRRVTVASCCIDNNMTAYLPDRRNVRSEWAFYWLSILDFGEFMNPGAVPSFSEGYQSILPIILPSHAEQQMIAAFLDRETSRLDRLVAKKRELIERLKEKRTALISRTVTRGLPPAAARAAGLPENPPLKSSGVEWLGDVPEHWEIKKFGQLSLVVRGASPRPAGDARYFDGDFMPWITVGEVTKDCNVLLTETETKLTAEGVAQSRTILSGTLVLTNSGATLGVPKILAITGCANDGIVVFERLAKDVEKLFLYYFLLSLTDSLRERVKQGSGQPNLNTGIIKSLFVPLPPLTEQAAIAAYLDAETSKLDALVAKVEVAIERLQEYRTALITAAVTGKIDVREESAA